MPDSLETGGSIGSLRGKFYEYYLIRLLESKGFRIDTTQTLKQKNIFYFRYRFPPDRITEIDIYFPYFKVGFWLTCIGKIKKIRCKECSSSKYNEFKDLKGVCPHCKEGNLPDVRNVGLLRWICPKCKKMVDPFELNNKICVCGSKRFEEYEDHSASSQAHKQTYYRIAEYFEVKTGDISDVICSEIIFNKLDEWRIWGKVLEKFFDSSLFVLEKNNSLFGSNRFNEEIWNFIDKNLKREYPTNKFSADILNYLSNLRKRKNKEYPKWISEISAQRKKYWSTDYPASYPIRYSIFTILKSLKQEVVADPYEIGAMLNCINKKPNASKPMAIAEKMCIKKGFIKDYQVTELGKKQIDISIKKYQEVVKKVKEYSGKFDKRDLWLKRKDIVVNVLDKLLKLSIENSWYKFVMIANKDIKQISSTPFINEQFEPLELLTLIFLDNFKDKGIISDFEGLSNGDVFEPTFLRDVFEVVESSGGYILGEDAKIILPNGKLVYLQCKSNTSFKKWLLRSEIYGSGISYKDAKRMIAHNILESFKFVDKKLIHDDNRYYVAVIDGDWASEMSDKYRLLKAMFILGVDEVFFADEIETRLKDFLIRVGSL